jgi:EcsC protein family
MKLEADDLAALNEAVSSLERPNFLVQLTNVVGTPVEYGVTKLPRSVSKRILELTHAALQKSLRVAVLTMSSECGARRSNSMHKIIATLSGAVGGAFGLPALAIELPVSTTVMLRSIVDIARSEGENIHDVETQLACLEVFALGAHSKADDGAETGYYATRAVLARAISSAASFITQNGLAQEGAPAIVRLITKIAARFSVPVSEKFAAQALPAIGAAGGAALNLVFINHFQDMARAHFTVRRLERKYGAEGVHDEYKAIVNSRG